MAEAAFWLARSALVVAGAAFLCYALVILGLVVASHFLSARPARHSARTRRRSS